MGNLKGHWVKETIPELNCSNHVKHTVPASLDTLEQKSKKQLPYVQNQHHTLAYICRAFSRRISFSHKVTSPVKEGNICIII